MYTNFHILDDEIDGLIKQYTGKTVDTSNYVKQRQVQDAQQRAK